MKKSVLLLLSFLLLIVSQKASAQQFTDKSRFLSFGYGAASFYVQDYLSDLNSFSRVGINDINFIGYGPTFLKFEFGVTEKIGFSLNVAASSYMAKWTQVYNYQLNYNNISFIYRFNYYFVNTEKFLGYYGAGVGYRLHRSSIKTDAPTNNYEKRRPLIPLGFETTLGFRLRISKRVALYVESGIAMGAFQSGLTFTL